MLECTKVELNDEQLECLRGCSSYTQYYHGRRAFEEGRCPFCQIDHAINTVLYNKGGWIAWEVPQNFTTRQSTLELQLVFFPKRHVRNPTDLTTNERAGYFDVISWAFQAFEIPGGGIINRFGDMRYNVGTIMHMHATIMVPNRKGSVMVPLQKNEARMSEDEINMRIFSYKYEAGKRPGE